MKQEEILEYNKRCAEFLGYELITPQMRKSPEKWNNSYWEHKDKANVDASKKVLGSEKSLSFNSDWNRIMEVLKQITKCGYNWELIDFNGTVREEKFMKCSIFNLQLDKPNHKFIFESSDAKEAVVQAIDSFLKFYNKNLEMSK